MADRRLKKKMSVINIADLIGGVEEAKTEKDGNGAGNAKQAGTESAQHTGIGTGKIRRNSFDDNIRRGFAAFAKQSKSSMNEVQAEQSGELKESTFEENIKRSFASQAATPQVSRNMAMNGCKLCTPAATCITHGGVFGPLQLPQLNGLRHEEDFMSSGRNPPTVVKKDEQLRETIKMSKTESKMDFTYDENKGIFCCGGNADGQFKHDIRASAVYLQEEKHKLIHEFAAAINADDINYVIGELTSAEMKAIKMVIKANICEDFEDVTTYLFVKTSEFCANPVKKFTCFTKLDVPQRFENMGERAYIAFYCKRHTKAIRIGSHTVKWSKKGTWAWWENKALDDLMGLPKKPANDFGQAPITFPPPMGV